MKNVKFLSNCFPNHTQNQIIEVIKANPNRGVDKLCTILITTPPTGVFTCQKCLSRFRCDRTIKEFESGDLILCTICSSIVLSKYKDQLTEQINEFHVYEESLRVMKEVQSTNEKNAQNELRELENTEKRLLNKLVNINVKISILKAKEKEWEILQNSYWKHFHSLQLRIFTQFDSRRSLYNQMYNISKDLHQLNRYNPLNSSFHIWHQHDLVTINSLKLGTVYNETSFVSWKEINLALGEVAMLLNVLCRFAGYKLRKYTVLARGSKSYVLNDSASYELFLKESGNRRDVKRRKTAKKKRGAGHEKFWLEKFNNGVVALVGCVDEVSKVLDMKIPFKIDYDGLTIGGVTVKYKQSNEGDKKWTCAMQYLLIDLKCIVKEIVRK